MKIECAYDLLAHAHSRGLRLFEDELIDNRFAVDAVNTRRDACPHGLGFWHNDRTYKECLEAAMSLACTPKGAK